MEPMVIFFAGATAAGKTDMAYYLSERFGWPIFSTDAIRRDTKVEKDVLDIHDALEAFETSRDVRSKALFEAKKSFIYDASVDRRWPELKQQAERYGFKWLVISFDLSRERIMKNKEMFDHVEQNDMFDKWIADHKAFLNAHGSDTGLHMTDDNYANRYELAQKLVSDSKK